MTEGTASASASAAAAAADAGAAYAASAADAGAATATRAASAETNAANAAVLERHFAEIQALYARAAGGEVLHTGELQLSASKLPARVLNAANLAQFTPESATGGIAEAKEFFGRFEVPFRWFFGPTSTPADLPERFEAAGLVSLSNSPGMVLDLAAMNDEPTTVSGLEVREVVDRTDFEAWLEVCRLAFPFDAVLTAAWRAVHEPLGFGDVSALRNYIGWLDGRAVAVSALLHARGVAGIWNVGTLPDARGRGIGRETTLAALRDARAAGHRLSVLGSSPMGLPVYSRIGFVEVCRIRHFGSPA